MGSVWAGAAGIDVILPCRMRGVNDGNAGDCEQTVRDFRRCARRVMEAMTHADAWLRPIVARSTLGVWKTSAERGAAVISSKLSPYAEAYKKSGLRADGSEVSG